MNPAEASCEIALVDTPIEEVRLPFEAEVGAEAQFLGVVRESEGGLPITGILYTAYEPMALRMMRELRDKAVTQYGEHALVMVHRLGLVPVREPSILIRVRTRHSASAFELCRWYLEQVKKTVPVWKEIVQ